MSRKEGKEAKDTQQERLPKTRIPVHMGETITKKYTEQELLGMKPAKDASPEEWRAWHQMLYDAGLLRPPK